MNTVAWTRLHIGAVHASSDLIADAQENFSQLEEYWIHLNIREKLEVVASPLRIFLFP